MKNYFAIAFLIIFGLFALLSSCREEQKGVSTEQLLKEIVEAILQEPEQDDKITFWKNMLNQDRYDSNRVAKARINYIMGKNFVPINRGKMREVDSIISKLSEMVQHTIRFIFLKIC